VYAVPGAGDASVGEPGTRVCSTERRSVRAIAIGQHDSETTDGLLTIGDDVETNTQCKRQQQQQGRDSADETYLSLALSVW